MADSKKYDGGQWEHSLRKLGTATDILTTLPADLYADGNNATVGLKGNMQQTGTPTPQNPIQPQETGERTGNLFDKYGSYSVGNTANNYTITGLKPNTQYTCSTNFTKTSNTASIYFGGGSSVTNGVWANNPNTQTSTAEGTMLLSLRFRSDAGAPPVYDDVMNGTIWVMVNEGSTPLPYEPYGIKIPILSANTTTPVYLGEVETERKIKKLVFTGQENNWTYEDTYERFGIGISNMYVQDTRLSTAICTHYPCIDDGRPIGEIPNNSVYVGKSTPSKIFIKTDSYTTIDTWKTYLQQQYAAGTPVTVWYVLATETTGIVNEPLRKIGDYADIVSGITIPTITGKDTVDVETTLKPSEVSLSYTGWHDASVKERDGSDWQ